LQLPLPNLDGTRWPIFDMLDNQTLTMALDLINTAATCQNLTVEQNRPGVTLVRLTNISCQIQPDNVATSTSFLHNQFSFYTSEQSMFIILYNSNAKRIDRKVQSAALTKIVLYLRKGLVRRKRRVLFLMRSTHYG
ncbi:unnamed protein product, partial [Adineta ricciae]